MSKGGITIPIPYGARGCEVNIGGNQTCSEKETLEIIKQFNTVYESKLYELTSSGGGDNLLAKVHLQQDWIRDLTQQNEMLVKVVEELEKEAVDRVSLLEERLVTSAQVIQKYKDNCSIYLNKTFQKSDYLQNDVSNLLEFIKRARDNDHWSTEGLQFYTFNASCLFQMCNYDCQCPAASLSEKIPLQCPANLQQKQRNEEIATKEAQKLDTELKEMEKRLSMSPKESDLQELSFKLHLKDEELVSVRRRSADIEMDCSLLRQKFKELENENNMLKDTIFQANRELEKFYDQAAEYVKERDEYKRQLKETSDSLAAAENRFLTDKQNLERKICTVEDTNRKLCDECNNIVGELHNVRRQSESMAQAQNETIQALQEAIREKDESQIVRVVPLTSNESWTSSSITTSTAVASNNSALPSNSSAVETSESYMSKLSQAYEEGKCPGPPCPVVCSTPSCGSDCPGIQELKKLQDERELERQIHRQEVDNLRRTITELEKGGEDSVKLLQEAYEGSKLEISRQRNTISNLQEALKTCKIELNDFQQKSSFDVSWATKWFGLSSSVSKMSANNNQLVHDV